MYKSRFIRSKCTPILLYAVDACPLLVRQIRSTDFTLIRIFVKLFRTESSSTVNECQVRLNLGFLPAESQILIHSAFCGGGELRNCTLALSKTSICQMKHRMLFRFRFRFRF